MGMKGLIFFIALGFTVKDLYALVLNAKGPREDAREVHAWFTTLLWAIFLAW